MSDPESRNDFQAEFEKCTDGKKFPYSDLEAHFHAVSVTWWFSTPQGKEAPRAEDRFKAVAAGAAVAFRLCGSDIPNPGGCG